MKPSDELTPIIPDAVKTLKRIFTDGKLNEEDLALGRLASATLSTWAKLTQTEGGQEAMYYSMARDIATNQEELTHYIKVTMPDVPLAKALTTTKNLPAKKLPAKSK